MLVSTSSPRIRAPCGRILFLPKQVVQRPAETGRQTAGEIRIQMKVEAAVKPRASSQKVQVNNQSRAGQPMDQTGGKNSSPAVSLQYETIAPPCPAKDRAEFVKYCQQISEQSGVEVGGSAFSDKR